MKRRRIKYRTLRAWQAFSFVLPFVLGLILFFLIPLIQTVIFSFNKVDVGQKGGYVLESVGLKNYVTLFTEEVTSRGQQIVRMLLDETGSILVDTPIIVVLSLFLALLVNRKFKGRALVRIIFFLPIILGVDVVVNLLSMTTGMTFTAETSSNVFAGFNISVFITKYTDLPLSVVRSIMDVVSNILSWVLATGVQTLVYLAALQSISPAYYEVADIEGATAYEKFWKVTMPSIRDITFFIVIYTIVMGFLQSSIAEEVYNYAFGSSKIGIGSALSIVYIFNVLIILAVVFLIFGSTRDKAVKERAND